MEQAAASSTEITTILAEVTTLRAEIQQLRTAQARRRSRLPGRLLRAALTAGLVALLLGSSASAAIPDANGSFSGCYRTAGSLNLLYVLDTATQKTCPTGMSLTSWQQSGLAAYGYLYNTSPYVLNTGDDVIFLNQSATVGLTNNQISSAITVATAGTYQVTYIVSPTAANSEFALTDNGSVVPGTSYGSANPGPYSGQALLTLAAGDALTLRYIGSSVCVLESQPDSNGTAVSLLIEKVG